MIPGAHIVIYSTNAGGGRVGVYQPKHASPLTPQR
jgi:hypothetical protein